MNTIYGWLVGFSCIIILALVSPAVGVGDSQFFVGTGMATGVGFMQNRMLHVSLGWNWNWMWTTIVGMTLSFVIFDFGPSILEMIPPFNLQMSIAVGGLFVGILQYGFLGTRSIKGGYWWILICFVGWTSAGLIVGLVDYLHEYIPRGPIALILNLPLMVFVSSLILRLVTGTGLIRLLKNQALGEES
ncbi:MAG: hypothetical protein ACJA01_002348 [Saprospiraceae bacterium]